jgi:hypothetical protein
MYKKRSYAYIKYPGGYNAALRNSFIGLEGEDNCLNYVVGVKEVY